MFNLKNIFAPTPVVAKAAPSPLAPKEGVKAVPAKPAAPTALEVAKASIEAEVKAKANAELEATRLAEEAKRAAAHVEAAKVAAATLVNARKESEAAYARLLIQKGNHSIAANRVSKADQALLDLVNGVERQSLAPVVIPIASGDATGNVAIEWDEPEPVAVVATPVAIPKEVEDYFALCGL